MRVSVIFYSIDEKNTDSIINIDVEPHKVWQVLNIITPMKFPSLKQFLDKWTN